MAERADEAMSKLSNKQMDIILKHAGIGTTEQLKEMEASVDEMRDFGNADELRAIISDIARHNRMLKERLTLVNDSLTRAIPLVRENLYLFAAYTGSGKSSCAANISYPLWKQGKKVLIISNEETQKDVVSRIACLEAGVSFQGVIRCEISKMEELSYVAHIPSIKQHVIVIPADDPRTTCIEGVKNILEAAKNEDFSAIIIDYFQLIKRSEQQPNKEPYRVMMEFKDYLNAYIKTSNAPVVMFAQLWSLSKRPAKDTELDSRLKECASIQDGASVVVEIVPNFKESTTDFLICKDRFFGRKGDRITCQYSKGRYLDEVSMTDLAKAIAQIKLEKLTKDFNHNSLSAGADYDAGKKT
jgi:replicative DNA helicase